MITFDNSSLTWSIHVRIICQMYDLPDPLGLLQTPAWPKEKWKSFVQTKITAYHERRLRLQASTSLMSLRYLNVSINGLSGRQHPVLNSIHSTDDVMKARIHVKMLSGDYPCNAVLGRHGKKDPSCLLCKSKQPDLGHLPHEDLCHMLTQCKATRDTRQHQLSLLLNVVYSNNPENSILNETCTEQLTQFVLDPSSINLPMTSRISPDNPIFTVILKACRNYCFFIHKDRIKKLGLLKQ